SPSPSSILPNRFHQLLSNRAYPKTVCPSEIARSLSASELHQLGVSAWRELMPQLRRMAFDARDRGELEILQGGRPVSRDTAPEDVKGPIRIRKVQSGRE
ncbi:hypothetical protein A1O3_01848, partial [Capronia epimyces CBS 606.96]